MSPETRIISEGINVDRQSVIKVFLAHRAKALHFHWLHFFAKLCISAQKFAKTARKVAQNFDGNPRYSKVQI